MRSVFRGAVPLLAVLALARLGHAEPTPPAADGPIIPAPAEEGDDPPADPHPTPRAVPLVPSGLPAAAPARPPTLSPLPKTAPPAPPPSPKTAPPAARPWPAAFRTCREAEPATIKQTTHVEMQTQAVPLTLPAPPADDPAALAAVRRRVRMLYGGGPATVTLEPQPDGSVLIHVRVRADDDAEGEDGAGEPPPAVPKLRVLVETEK